MARLQIKKNAITAKRVFWLGVFLTTLGLQACSSNVPVDDSRSNANPPPTNPPPTTEEEQSDPTGTEPGFGTELTVTPADILLPRGGELTLAYEILPEDDYSGKVQATVSGLPAGVDYTADDLSGTQKSGMLTLTATHAAVAGEYTPKLVLSDGNNTLEAAISLRIPASGSYVKTFGNAGTADVTLPLSGIRPVDFEVTSDQSIIILSAVPNASGAIYLQKLGQNGMVDPSFGEAGLMNDANAAEYTYSIKSLKVDSLNRIWVFYRSNSNFVVSRYNASGSVDTSFGTDGTTTVNLGLNAYFWDAEFAQNGKLLLAGRVTWEGMILRVNDDGSLDDSFGTNGRVLVGYDTNAKCDGIAIDSNGRLTASCNTTKRIVNLIRLQNDGNIDTSFGYAGYVPLTEDTNIDSSLEIDGDDRIYYSTVYEGKKALTIQRFMPNGITDATYANAGTFTADTTGSDYVYPYWHTHLALDGENNAYVVSGSPDSADWNFERGWLFKALADGTSDMQFGTSGKVWIDSFDPSLYWVEILQLAIAGDKLLVLEAQLDSQPYGGTIHAFWK